jgi:predicted Zn-dependent peptidase
MYKKTTFPSGLRLITVPMKSTKTVTVFVLFAVGSRYETKEINGGSHFIEHLMFKGTKKRPAALTISKALDSVGAEFNAMTAKDWTGYYVKVNSKHVTLAMDILSDILQHSLFDKKEMDKERGVIVEEINMYQDNPLMHIEDLIEEVVFKGSTLGWDITGPREVIKSVPRDALVSFMKHHYIPTNTVIGVAGNVTPAKATQLTRKYFPVAKAKAQKRDGYAPFTYAQQEPRLVVQHKATEQVQLAIGFPGYSYGDPRMYALQLLTIILGGNMSARLFTEVREQRGLAYSVRAYTNVYEDTGMTLIQAGLDKAPLEEAFTVIMRELKKVRDKGVTPAELKKAKEFLRGKVTLRLEDTSNIADWYAKQELLQHETLTPDEKLRLFDRVTVAQISQVAQEVFQYEMCSVAVIGPYKDVKFLKPLITL